MSNKTKHTPGPWRAEHYTGKRWYVVGRTDTVVPASADLDEADARLIAAAPEMAALLRKIQPFLTTVVVESEDVSAKVDALLARIDGD